MLRGTIVARVASGLLAVGLAGCASQTAQDAPAVANAELAESGAAWLTGTWQGEFYQTGMGDAGVVSGDIACEIGEDGAYKLVWGTRLVAGSSRAGRMETKGTAMVDGKSVVFDDSTGSRFTLRRSGDTLYGIRRDPAGGRANVIVELHKVSGGSKDPNQRQAR